MKKTKFTNRLLSLLLALVMIVGMFPVIHTEAEAASNMENGFEGQDADIFSALGFDTTVTPEGYDAETTENPYGRDTILGNQVWEAFVASSGGTKMYGKGDNTVTGASISGMPGSGSGIGMELFAVAAADFDGDGLQGEVVYVGFDDVKHNTYKEKANLQIRIYDAKNGSISDLKTVGTGINPAQATRSGGTAYSCYDYAWQNLLQVTAGDYDGDGRYEIAVYVAEDGNNRVDIYKYQQTSQSGANDWMQMSNWDRVWTYVVSNTGNEVFNMVSLVSADINRDGVDDLGISYGRLAPYGNPFASMDIDKSKAVILWGGKSNMLQKNSPVNLNEGELGAQTRVSLTVGDLDGDGTKELIATGEPVSDVEKYYSGEETDSNTTRSIITYIYDSAKGLVINSSGLYKPVDGKIVTSENSETGTTEGWQSNNGFDSTYRSQPLMRTNAAAFHAEGYDYPFLYLDSCLYECMAGQFTLKMSLDDESYDGQSTLGGDGFWGVKHDYILTQYVDDYVEYGVVAGDLNGEGYDTLLTNAYRWDSYEKSAEEARHASAYFSLYSTGGALATELTKAYIQKSNNPIISVYTDYTDTLNSAALALVDADLDTVILEYTGVHYLTYSDPEVLAIIAAAPYFEDVDIISDYDYAWQNATSYSRTQGSSHSDHVAVDFEVGVFGSMETEVGGGKISLETSANFTLEWEEETTQTTEYTLSFETSQDEDAVAFYCIPTETYIYRIKTPDGKGGYTETLDEIVNTFTPCYQVLNLDYYESIQGNYDSLPEIRGKAITSVPGDPSSYPASTSGYNVISQWNDHPAGVSFGNGAITQEITITQEEAEHYNMGAAWDFQFGGGIGAQSDLIQYEMDILGGVQWSLNPTGGFTDVNMEGTTISGTVTNMPLEFQDYGYYYTWKLFSYNYKFDNGTSIPVISYVVGDVSEPPQLPEDFQQDYDRTTSDKNVLTWTYDANFSNFYIYKYYDFPVGGGLQLVKTVPSSTADYTVKYDEAGKPYKEYFFEDPNLAAYTEYQYAIQVERLAKVPPLSAPSGLLSARTKASNGYPVMTMAESDGENDGKLKVYPDKNAYLTVGVTGPEGEKPGSYYTTVQYQWQKVEEGAWVDLTNETSQTLTFAGAGVDTAGAYRCRVNVLTKEDATAITAYTDPVELTHAKRTSYFEEVYAKDVSGGVELYAKVCNAHGDSASIPGGIVTFNLTNNATGQHFQYFVELNAAGVATDIREAMLPEGMYTVSAYYSGSFIFKACSEQTLYLSQRSAGYDVDVLSSLYYGEGTQVVFRSVSKRYGMTVATETQPDSYSLLQGDALDVKSLSGASAIRSGEKATAGKNYYIEVDAVRYYFTATHSGYISVEGMYVTYGNADAYLRFLNDGGKYDLADNTPAGSYVVKMSKDGEATYAQVIVKKRPVTLQLPTQQIGEGIDHAPYVTVGSMEVLTGSWAPCDMTDGKLNSALADKIVSLKYYNTAGKAHTGTEVVKQCGYYTIRDWGSNAGLYPNYDVKLMDGEMTVIGATRDVSIGVRAFEGQSVGTLYAISPEYDQTRLDVSDKNALVQSFATGTRMVFTAVADEGYEIYDWYINGVAQGSKASSLALVLLAEDTTVEVQFAIKQNNLIFGVIGDEAGGIITCSDPDLTSDSVVLANARFTFTATANKGYHFKEWRYTEVGKGTSYDSTDNGKQQSTFDLLMPATGCSVYAVFERDSYTFTYSDRINGVGLTAWYMGNTSGDSTVGLEKVTVRSGEKIKGDTTIVVEAAAGYDLDADYAFTSTGTQGHADYTAGTYTLKLTEDTDVTAVARQQYYDVQLNIETRVIDKEPEGLKVVYTIGEEETSITSSTTVTDVAGGSDISLYVDYPGYYNLIGWYADHTRVTASADVNKAAVEVKYDGEVEAGTAYWYSVAINNANVIRYFVAPVDGIVRWDGEDVTVYIQNVNCRIDDLDQDETLTVYLEEKPVHTVTLADITGKGTYIITVPEGGTQTAGANNVTTVKVHEGDDLTVLVDPEQKWTVSYWQTQSASMPTPQKVRATSLKYTIPDIREGFTFTPIFSSTTYNTISWSTISQELNGITLSPESGYLSSVSAGSDFKFTLSGKGLGLVDQVLANGIPFVDASSTNAGSCTVSNGVYTISNVQENQEITVTLKQVGVTVNGEDLVNMAGTGWTYNHDTQTLTITRPGLVVSGSVKLSTVDMLTIVLAESAASVTLENLNLVSKAPRVIQTLGETNTVVISGENTVSGAANATYGIYGNQNLVLRGNGSLNITGAACGICAVDTATVTGDCAISIDSGADWGVSANTLNVGVENSTANPTLRIETENGWFTYGILVLTVNLHTGELLVNAEGSNAIVASDAIHVYGGILEANATGSAIIATNGMYAHYPNGYMKRYATSTTAEADTMTIGRWDYSDGSYDNILLDRYYVAMSPTYLRVSPLSTENLGQITLTVTYNGKEYSAPISGDQYKYYYIDLDHLYDTKLKSFNHNMSMADFRPWVEETDDHNWLVVAYNQQTPQITYVEPQTVNWVYYKNYMGNSLDGYVPEMHPYDGELNYRLSGGSADTFGDSIEIGTGVKQLSLDNLTGGRLHLGDTPAYLWGDNYLITLSGVPLSTNGTLNLRSDGSGTLTVNARTISDYEGFVPESALAADRINLYDVKSLTLFSATEAVTSDANVEVHFYDGDSELTYGQGWGIDEGTNGATASTRTSATVGNGEYVKIYANTTDGVITPNYLSVDKYASDPVRSFELKYGAVDGKLTGLKTETSGDQTYTTVLLIDPEGKETELKLAKSGTTPSGYNGCYTDNGTGATLTLDLGTMDLDGMALGTYTLRFRQEDAMGNLHATDAILNITSSATWMGDLFVEPGNVTLSPGQSVTFSASYEGTTPNSYGWYLDISGEPVQKGVNSKFTYTVPEDAKAGQVIHVTVCSYSGDTLLGVAQASITVCDAARDIQITTDDLAPAEDGSYTVHSVTPTGDAGTYDFDATVTMRSGATADTGKVSFRLWGNNLRATAIDTNTGVLTVSRKETGTNGVMKVIATYTNDDGTAYSEEILLHISTDAYVDLNVAGTVNGEAVADLHGTVSANLDEEGYVADGTAVVVAAQPDENHQIAGWTFSGNEISGQTPEYTVDEATNTLTFEAKEFGLYTVSVEFTHYHDQLKHDDTNHWYECSCGDITESAAHYDDDKDHNCDLCGYVMSVCLDEDRDHFCDWCGVQLTECADDSKDHYCDWCGKQLSDHADEDEDHLCDYCGEKISECADENNNHFCDFCKEKMTECADLEVIDEAGHTDHNCDICGRTLTDCADSQEDADHSCDICGKVLEDCADSDSDHLCDVCGERLTECADADNDHLCDLCGETLSECADENSDHLCDLCGETVSECADADGDHKCDVCGETLTECADEDKDHKCDLCGETLSECADEDRDHCCDYCGAVLSECADRETTDEAGHTDHYCDYCGKRLTSCADEDGDQFCDICGKVMENHDCADEDRDHLCDICGETVSECADADNDHKCDICGETLTECADGDHDHKCDLCGETLTECADADHDHKCDICGETLSQCADENRDHHCDICGAELSHCDDTDPMDHICDLCGAILTVCVDEDADHVCDICRLELNWHCDENGDHKCDAENCGKVLSECADENRDHVCDICGETLSDCVDEDQDHKCDYCGQTASECTDDDHDHKCDICGSVLTQCADEDGDGLCDICGKDMHECADEDQDHLCDTCGFKLSECVDEETDENGKTDHLCDICGKANSVCADGDNDHLCDICGEKLTECFDEDDHKCDICGETVSECADADHNDVCDICGAATFVHTDDNSDHRCDVCALPLSECVDEDCDHLCDICGAVWSVCVDLNKDHVCDICGATVGSHASMEGSHICEYCGKTVSECADTDNDHYCDICGLLMSECCDLEPADHHCDICGKKLSECADDDRDHKCDICGETLSECADGDSDHRCDYCDAVISQCEDLDGDHKCDLCGETVSECTDENGDHLCDICGEILSECADGDGDHFCDICGKKLSKCIDEDGDHHCDICDEPMPTHGDCPRDDSCILIRFEDVVLSEWYHDGLHYCVEKGIMNGISENLMAPYANTKRAELVTMLYRIAGSPSVEGLTEPFADVNEGEWFYEAVVWAYQNNVVKGVSATAFDPGASITREQLVTILYRYTGEPEVTGTLEDYPDAGTVSDFAREAVIWAVSEDLIRGVSQLDGTLTLSPAGYANRAQIATILMRYLT